MEENKKSQSALREESVLQFWKENDTFKKSLEKESPKGEYVFYEGPPTANGKPGIHHLEARAFKDAIPRYKTMRGYHVRRKGGWDTHGLPVELQVEKKLGLASKKAIEEYGIAKFNQECKESVWEYTDLWEKFTDRIGYWVDQKNAYVTYHNDYIESVWNVIKEADKQKLLYKDYKVVPWCPRCGTGLSSHELAQGYVDVKDLSVYAKFRLVQQVVPSEVEGKSLSIGYDTYILAWTTTPWTLPGNVALAVGEDIDYVKIEISSDLTLAKGEEKMGVFLILAKSRLSVIEGEYKTVEEFKGKDLIGLEYEPLYPYLSNILAAQAGISDLEKQKLDKAFKVYGADFVTTEDGTGVVHTAVMYGVDDFVLGNKIGLPKHHMVGLDGKFLEGTDFLEGRFVRDEDVAVDIIKDLAHRGLLFKKEKYEHSYPHCWRCKTALIYYARDSWYIRMSSLRDKMVEENESINWEPSYIKDGRFGEWLKDIKDWAISRERYWGTPLPVWSCNECKKYEVIGSLEDIKSKTKKSGNKYFIMRHGVSEANICDKVSCNVNDVDHLTEEGKKQVLNSIEDLKNKKINLIISSDFIRTKETAEIIKDTLNIKEEDYIFEKRIRELNVGVFDGKTWSEYYGSREEKDWYSYKPQSGESCKEVKFRMTSFLYELEQKYKDKNILIVTHEGPARMLLAGILGLDDKETEEQLENKIPHLENASVTELDFIPLPHNENYELDFHKPYIDEVELNCQCGGKLERTKEVMDVWLDSGTMPFSQDHYPFDFLPQKSGQVAEGRPFENKQLPYPADFICEAMDQTRGWFYTLHAVGMIMGKGKAYKNVICLGLLLDAQGKKMSKSLGNIVDPWEMMHKYGADTIRLWMYSVNQPGDPKSFDEKVVSELHNKVFNLLYNVLAFYELYRDPSLETKTYKLESDSNILDQWIIARLSELTENMTKQLDGYKLLEPIRAIRDFIDDLSTWYLRRSRDRIKNNDQEAKITMYYVLKTLVKLMAPFAPFAAEDIWQRLKNNRVSTDETRHDFAKSEVESVHLADWPELPLLGLLHTKGEGKYKVLEEMQQVRKIVTLGLQARQKAGIPVRQPLSDLSLKNYELDKEYTKIIKEELNIKIVMTNSAMTDEVVINTNIDPKLKREGQYRELVRAIQDIRKKNGLNPSDIVTIVADTNSKGQELVNEFKTELMKAVSAKDIQMKENSGEEMKIGEFSFKILIEK